MWKKVIAELIASFIFVSVIICVVKKYPNSGWNPLIIGLTLTGLIYLIGGISGGHVNPIVSLAFWKKGSISGRVLGSYVAAQITGALLASLCSKKICALF